MKKITSLLLTTCAIVVFGQQNRPNLQNSEDVFLHMDQQRYIGVNSDGNPCSIHIQKDHFDDFHVAILFNGPDAEMNLVNVLSSKLEVILSSEKAVLEPQKQRLVEDYSSRFSRGGPRSEKLIMTYSIENQVIQIKTVAYYVKETEVKLCKF